MNESYPMTQVIIEENKLPQSCPDWVKITEIPHPALVPGFISRRECLPDGSIDPNTPSVSTQITLLQASNLSPSLASVVTNIPSGLMCESIHKRNIKEVREEEEGISVLKEGFVITHPPAHFKRASDSTSTVTAGNTANDAIALANKTASELTAMNILYGGVRGKAYLDSLKSFVNDAVEVQKGSRIEALLRDKLSKTESACGYKIFNSEADPVEDYKIDANAPIIEQNHQICRLLNNKSLEESRRSGLKEKLRDNLRELMKECPEEIKAEKFKGVSTLI